MSNKIGIIDEPITSKKDDALKISIHANSLVKFIENTTTPMTIGIQGEWGSGKTSLLNAIKERLSDQPKNKQIWINSWENALLTSAEETLIKIVNAIIEELLESDKDMSRKEKILSAASTVFKGAMRVGAAATVGTEAGEQIANEFLGKNNNGIKNLKSQLQELALNIRKRPSNPYEKIIIYVDDLDRIEPREAVKILELLKNIFSIPGCVFVLAIDYQVVVKGLEDKFGKQSSDNEWEFRAFFDKIIQLPFMMPMGQYDIGNYVSSLLADIGFMERHNINEEDVKEIVLLSIGSNPRAIKRLINSVSLIEIFSEEKLLIAGVKNKIIEETEEEKFLLFSLLCLQIAYPEIYSLLMKQPSFDKWNDNFAFEHTNKKEEKEKEVFDREFKNAIKNDNFDEEWEQSLFRICYIKPRLRTRVAEISKFLTFIKDKYTDDTDSEDLGNIIKQVLSKTAVTNVAATDKPQNFIVPEREAGSNKRRYLDNINTYLYVLENENKIKSGSLKIVKYWYDKTLSICPKAVPMFTTGITFYLNKKKFMRLLFVKGNKFVTQIQLLKHYKNDYKIPIMQNIISRHGRKYVKDKLSTTHNSQFYELEISDEKNLKNMEDKIVLLIKEGFDMASNSYDKILKIDYWNYSMKSNKENITKNKAEIERMSEHYLNQNYTYKF